MIAEFRLTKWSRPPCWALGVLACAGAMAATQPEVPVAAGVTFTIAVSNATASLDSRTPVDVAQGDYEVVVTITAVDRDTISHNTFIDAVDGNGLRRQVSVPRKVRRSDLASAPLQILGFHSTDPPVIDGSTSLGPSRAVVGALLKEGRSAFSFRNFVGQPLVSGTLVRDEQGPIAFPVLINGRRVELAAIRATGQMSAGAGSRPFELVVLDDPQHPLSLRVAYGARGAGFPFKPDFAREIVRIDFPAGRTATLDEALQHECRVEVPGIYFDFNQATLKPESRGALEDIAAALRKRPQQKVRIEGHTDNIGGDRYNDELSTRRAAAVRSALEHDFKLDAALITAVGRGARQPVETNNTLPGRARNRRVELVRDCAGAARPPAAATPIQHN